MPVDQGVFDQWICLLHSSVSDHVEMAPVCQMMNDTRGPSSLFTAFIYPGTLSVKKKDEKGTYILHPHAYRIIERQMLPSALEQECHPSFIRPASTEWT